MRHESFEIVICPSCNGRGYKTYEECVDYHKREYETIKTVCDICDGSGRLNKIVRTTFEKLKPYEIHRG